MGLIRTAVVSMVALFPVAAAFGQSGVFEGGDWRVTSIRTGSGMLAAVTLDPPPAACGGGTSFGAHIRISSTLTQEERQAPYATFLAAYSSGDKIGGIWFFSNSGPCDNNTILDTYMIRTKVK